MLPIRILVTLCLFVVVSGVMVKSYGEKSVPVMKSVTYVIVHGAWGGGWAFREVDGLLTKKGHAVFRPTLTGQGERVHLAGPQVGLETHIMDVVNTILFEELDNVILVGHSYGGMVVTGVADRIPERIGQLIYLDTFVPEDGESSLSIGTRSEADKAELWGKVKDGGVIPSWVDPNQPPPKDVPHPVKTLTDPLVLKNPARLDIPTAYVLFVDPGKEGNEDDFFPHAERARVLGWPVYEMESDHNAQWSAPVARKN
jgi:pimeloyl-ACP methyl ester carboxylesterase